MIAKKLIVTATEVETGLLLEESEKFTYDFPVYEFENGLILRISYSPNSACFFEDRNSIEADGGEMGATMQVSVAETESRTDFSLQSLEEGIEASLAEFGSVPKKALAMLS